MKLSSNSLTSYHVGTMCACRKDLSGSIFNFLSIFMVTQFRLIIVKKFCQVFTRLFFWVCLTGSEEKGKLYTTQSACCTVPSLAILSKHCCILSNNDSLLDAVTQKILFSSGTAAVGAWNEQDINTTSEQKPSTSKEQEYKTWFFFCICVKVHHTIKCDVLT